MDRTGRDSCAAPGGRRPKPCGHELAAAMPRLPIRRHRINGHTASIEDPRRFENIRCATVSRLNRLMALPQVRPKSWLRQFLSAEKIVGRDPERIWVRQVRVADTIRSMS